LKGSENCNSNVSSTPNRNGQKQIHHITVGHTPHTTTKHEHTKYQTQKRVKYKKEKKKSLHFHFVVQCLGFLIDCSAKKQIKFSKMQINELMNLDDVNKTREKRVS